MNVNEDKLLEYLLGECSKSEEKMIKNKMAEDNNLRLEYEQLAKVWNEFQESKPAEPTERLQQRFDAWLKKEVNSPHRLKLIPFGFAKYAAAVAVLSLAVIAVVKYGPRENNSPSLHFDGTDITWASTQSTTQRISSIYKMTGVDQNNPELIALLISLLQEDESPNVRLTALEALQTFGINEDIRKGMMTALKNERKPVVQIALITALVGLKESDAKPQLEALLNDENIEPYVKDEAQLGLTRL